MCNCYFYLIIKTSSTGPSFKNKAFYKLLSQPNKHLHHGKRRKHNSGKLPTVDCTLVPIRCSGVQPSVGKVIPHSNLGRLETPCELECSAPSYFKLQWMSCGRSSSMSNSSISKCKLAEQTMIWVRLNLVLHTQPSNTTSKTQWQETLIKTNVWPPNTPGAHQDKRLATKYTWRSGIWRWHTVADPTPENNA